ncbi:MAG: glucosaminidase domain-containing protein [Rhodospirillaceae bacterium]|jgi:Bax protein|nr:glucosaminidase domain-containing protein [Rhodospirillaceae bacterium]
MAFLKTLALTIIGALRALILWMRTNPIEAQISFVVLLALIGRLQLSDDTADVADGRIILAGDALAINTLENTFESYGYNLDNVRNQRQPVPRLIAADVPDGLKDMRVIERRKSLFFRTVLPMILIVNESIASKRSLLLELQAITRSETFEESDLDDDGTIWLIDMAKQYGIDMDAEDVTLQDAVDVLTLRVAPIPTSLAMAQAVEESAWGTSRFAREGNALFGQWVWSEDAGIVPEDQREGQAYAVRAFDSPLQSVLGYAKNLNTHWAYTSFREQRAALLDANEALDGWALAETLTRYSERGENYVKSLRAIMRVNNLRPLDNAELASPETMVQLAEAR